MLFFIDIQECQLPPGKTGTRLPKKEKSYKEKHQGQMTITKTVNYNKIGCKYLNFSLIVFVKIIDLKFQSDKNMVK